MQLEKAKREINNAQSGRFTQRIGSTVYTVNIFFKEGSSEKLEDKVLRLIKSDLEFNSNRDENLNFSLKNVSNHGMMVMPQADWLPGRSSV